MKLRKPRREDVSVYRPGDILLFSGLWSDRASRAIKVGTCSRWTHVAGCVYIAPRDIQDANVRRMNAGEKPMPVDAATWRSGVYLFEATTLCDAPCLVQLAPVSGVQVHPVTERVCGYKGTVALRRLITPMTRLESKLLTVRVLDTIGKQYDFSGAGISATWIFKWWAGRRKASNTAEMFCSEELLECYQFALYRRLTRRVTSGAYPPRDVASWGASLYGKTDLVKARTR